MNNQDRLFTNHFVRSVDHTDLPSSTVKGFRNFLGDKNNETKKNQAISNAAKIKLDPPEPTFYDKTPIQKGSSTKIEYITKVPISTSDRDIYAYPLQNDFSIFLGRTFKNVSKIELISTEIPNTDNAIKDLPVELTNNIVTWINKEDFTLNIFNNNVIQTNVPNTVDITVIGHNLIIGSFYPVTIFNSKLQTDTSITGIIDGYRQVTIIDVNTLRILFKGGLSIIGSCGIDIGLPEYSITLVPGNPTASSLTTQIQTQCNLIKRQNGGGQYHYYNTYLNLYTNVITFESVITTQLTNNPLATIAGSTIITITAVSHGFKTGDTVLMINVQNTASINGSVLSGNFVVIVIDFNTFTYEVNVPAVATTNGGGNFVRTGTQAPYQFLFKSANTLIQFNTGFEDEDSSDYAGAINPITTKSLNISYVVIQNSNTLLFTTTTNHGLFPAVIIDIISISTGSPLIITTATQHLLTYPMRVTIRNSNSNPSMNGDYYVYPSGKTTLFIYTNQVNISGNSGQLLYGGDHIQISGLLTTPRNDHISMFYIESTPTNNTFTINFSAIQIDQGTVFKATIDTNQLFVNDVNHLFNNLMSITAIDSIYTSITLQLPTKLSGSNTSSVTIIAGPVTTNTVDILLIAHGLSTSDIITIKNSNTNPIVDGTYKVEVISNNELRINFVNIGLVTGTGTIITGDAITIISSTSFPRIDGSYNINNKYLISTISTGNITSTITLAYPANFNIGDIITLSETNTTPFINGKFIIYQITSPTIFTILLTHNITASGTGGVVINNTTLIIETGFKIITSGIPSNDGNCGIIGRNQILRLYRVASDDLNGYTIGGMTLSSINGIKFQVAKLIDINNYMVRVEGTYAKSTVSGGGSNVYISSLNKGFRAQQSNTKTGDTTGKLARSINLSGENSLYMLSPGISRTGRASLVTTSQAVNKDIFAKLLLSQSPGLMIYDSFISAPVVFSPLLPTLETMPFKIVTKQGFLFNFNNIEFDITIAITEIVDNVENSFISSRTGNNLNNTVVLPNDQRIRNVNGSVNTPIIKKYSNH